MKRFAFSLLALTTPLLLSAHPGHEGHDFEWGYTPLVLAELMLIGSVLTGYVLRRRESASRQS